MEKAEKAGWSSIVERHKKLFVEMSEHEVVEMAKRYIHIRIIKTINKMIFLNSQQIERSIQL